MATRCSGRPLWPLILLAAFIFSGCTTINSMETQVRTSLDSRLRAKPSEGAGFVPMQQLAKRPDLPFDKVWVKQGVDWKRYRTIYIEHVNTDYLLRANWWQEGLRADQMQQDVQNMANFMRNQFIEAFQNDPQHRLRVVMIPEKDSLTLELALTELVPGHVLLNAIKVAGPYGSGLAAAVLERGTDAQSTVAFEARIRDTDTGATLAMFADREHATARPIDLKGFTWYGNAQDIVKTWSQQLVQVANRRPGEIVKPASTFSLMPW